METRALTIMVPVDVVRSSVSEATYESLVRRLSIGRKTKAVQLLQLLRYVWTEELVRILTAIGEKEIAFYVQQHWLVTDRGTVYADIVGLDHVSGEETRDAAVKRLLKAV